MLLPEFIDDLCGFSMLGEWLVGAISWCRHQHSTDEFLCTHLVTLLVHRLHDVNTSQYMHRVRDSIGDDVQVSLPHVSAYELQIVLHRVLKQIEETVESLFLAILVDPQKPPHSRVDLVDLGAHLTPFLPLIGWKGRGIQ